MELFNSRSFQAMESGLNAMWLQMQISAQNIANLETPGYKSKAVRFEDILKNERQSGRYAFRTSVVEDSSTTARPDGNNVDMNVENTRAITAAIQYNYLLQKLNGQFSNMRYVMENAPR